MLKHNKIILPIMVLTITVLGTMLIISPTKTAYGQDTVGDILRDVTQGNTTQGNTTQGNLTAVVDAETLINNIQERHPILAQMTADEDQDLMTKIKGSGR